MNSVSVTGLRKIEKGVYICKELSWGFMFEEKELLAVRSDYVNAEGQWNETFIKAHAEARPDCQPAFDPLAYQPHCTRMCTTLRILV